MNWLIILLTGFVPFEVEMATFEQWFAGKEGNIRSGELYVSSIPNTFCSSLTMSTGTDCHTAEIGVLPKWFFGLECMRKCNSDNCMSDFVSLNVHCKFDEDNNNVTNLFSDLLWSATCYCPTDSVHADLQFITTIVTVSEMKNVYDSHSCSQASASDVSKISICGTNGRSLHDWLKTHSDVNFNASVFNLKNVPNLMCSIATESKDKNCENAVSILPKWYFSQKCMEKCCVGKCAYYSDLEVNCLSMPTNNEVQTLPDFSFAAQCVCPECSLNNNITEVVFETSLQTMFDEYTGLLCHDSIALIRTADMVCNGAAASELINEGRSGPFLSCDKHAEHIDASAANNSCRCKEGYTGNGYECKRICFIPHQETTPTGIFRLNNVILDENDTIHEGDNVQFLCSIFETKYQIATCTCDGKIKPGHFVCKTADCANKSYDILIILDGSGSIGSANFDTLKSFIQSFISLFNIGEDKSRVAFIQFSSEYHMEFNFNAHSDIDSLNSAIENVVYMHEGTRLGRALLAARNEVLTAANGRRSGVDGKIIIITDGTSEDDPIFLASTLKLAGYDIWSVGLGKYLNRNQLKPVASDYNQVLLEYTFVYIANILDKLKVGICGFEY